LALMRETGLLEYVGRIDRQLKIRGFRIEPSEIEAVLLSHPQIGSAAVVARRTAAGTTALAAHVVARGGTAPPQQLRTYLAERLPEHMVPATIAFVDALPLTSNGKIDYPQLAAAAVLDDGERLRELLERIESASAEEIALLMNGSNP
jgi:acyl-coenzyme A synthetase/AMP-(fatty) acid ligase